MENTLLAHGFQVIAGRSEWYPFPGEKGDHCDRQLELIEMVVETGGRSCRGESGRCTRRLSTDPSAVRGVCGGGVCVRTVFGYRPVVRGLGKVHVGGAPRWRGNQYDRDDVHRTGRCSPAGVGEFGHTGSIGGRHSVQTPWWGEPPLRGWFAWQCRVQPIVGGEIVGLCRAEVLGLGVAPRVRGNHGRSAVSVSLPGWSPAGRGNVEKCLLLGECERCSPAGAGESCGWSPAGSGRRVQPRGCGGICSRYRYFQDP